MNTPPIVLVPGFWLGGWAWDEVAATLRGGGHEVTAVTLPGLESVDADRSAITLKDHVEAICDAVKAAGPPVVLAVHSGAGVPGYGASDRIPEQIAAMVYVDTGPATEALDPAFDAAEKAMPSAENLAAAENLDGLTEEQLETFRRRAVPEPGAALREGPELTNDARLDVPSTVVCTGYTSEQYKDAVKEGQTWLGGLAELRDVTYVDLPTSHWPMWSRPRSSPRSSAKSQRLTPAASYHGEPWPRPRCSVLSSLLITRSSGCRAPSSRSSATSTAGSCRTS